jgi:endonuclease YncB( thermonuclease family)
VKTILLGSVLGAVGVMAVGNTNWKEPWAALPTELPRLQVIRGDTYNKVFMNCGLVRQTCVVDGDTIWLEGVNIRVLDIDAPEISKPNCLTEKALGLRAKSRLLFWLNEGPFEVSRGWGWDQDAYGRKLRYLTRDGVSVGDVLIAEGLAAPWIRRNRSWCS